MARVKYAVAGSPVSHSLSPLLFGLVVSNLEKFGKKIPISMKHSDVELVETKGIEDALGWGYAGHSPHVPIWQHTGAPFGKYRTEALLARAIQSAMEIEDSDSRLVSKFESELELETSSKPTPVGDVHEIPSQWLDNEVWLNLTSPLKHQLSSEAVSTIDESMKLQSVNALRWDGQGWWCAGVDGLGVVSVAQYHGVDVESGAVLGLRGGGGAARSTAYAWLKAGGRIRLFEGRRTLELPFDFEEETSQKPLDFAVDFDGGPDPIPSFQSCSLQLNPNYHAVEGGYEHRVQLMENSPFDGRWMLAAQHLEAWRNLWAPQYDNYLPSLGLLLSQLLHAENILFDNA
tara:strand:+ start:23614 stop:24648 length:1035 start_codon:yes stop_codon:yes gene_type:complete